MTALARAFVKRKPLTYDARALYTELESIKPLLTQFDMEAESGLGRATIQRIKAGKMVSRATYDDFAAYVARYRASPWALAPEMDAQRKRYEWFQSTQPRHVFKEWLEGLESALLSSRHLTGDASLGGVFALWLLAWIAQDLAKEFGVQPAENHAKAVARYDLALAQLGQVSKRSIEPGLSLLIERLRFARFIAYFNGKNPFTRSRDPAFIQWIKKGDVQSSLLRLHAAAPHDWSIQRNGLAVSSFLKDEAGCWFFFDALIASDPRFSDLSFAPSGGAIPSLSCDPDFWFFQELLKVCDSRPTVSFQSLDSRAHGEGP